MIISRKRNTFMVIFTLALMTCFFTLPGKSAAQSPGNNPLVQAAPVNPAFQKYMDEKALNASQKIASRPNVSDDGHALGHIPSPIKLPPTVASQKIIPMTLPVSFDLRTSNPVGVTPVKNQHGCGSCWAFAAMGSLESYMKYKRATTASFSEEDLNEYHGFDWAVCMGGNWFLSSAYFARWGGPETENGVPYPFWFTEGSGYPQTMGPDTLPPPSTISQTTPGTSNAYHIQNVYLLSNAGYPLTSNEITMLKNAIYSNGGVDVAFYWSAYYYKGATHAFYNNVSGASTGQNHEVVVVGWDDNFPKSSFRLSPSPPGNGAFIVKNSWGTGWGENGYFYLSYYDMSLSIGAQYIGVEAATNYKRIYQYDPLGWVVSYGWTDTVGWMANMFMASPNASIIKAVSFYTPVANCPYELYLYSNVTPGSPRSGSNVFSGSGTIDYPGYRTIPITPTAVTPNAPFSVVVKLTTPGYNYPIPAESTYPGFSTAATACPGMSYISHDGSTWDQAYYYDPVISSTGDFNVALKAFADMN